MDKDIVDEFLNLLYFQSREDPGAGCPVKRISRLLGLSYAKYKSILYYLIDEELIRYHARLRDHILLTSRGMEEVRRYRADKQFAIIRFNRSQHIPRKLKVIAGFLFYYDIIHPNGRQESKMIGVFATDLLCIRWDLHFDGEGILDTQKILLQFALHTVIARLQRGILSNQEEVILQANMQPGQCPYDPEKLIEMAYTTYEVDMPRIRPFAPEGVPEPGIQAETGAGKKRMVFISYSHNTDEVYLQWVYDLSKRIEAHDIDMLLDQERLGAGDNKHRYMDQLLKADKVLIIFTPEYKFKAEERLGGVGKEYALIEEDLYGPAMLSNKKYLPVLKSGNVESSIPLFMRQFIAVDMRNPARYEQGLQELINAILDKPPAKGEGPRVGTFGGTDLFSGNLSGEKQGRYIPSGPGINELRTFGPLVYLGKDLLSAMSEWGGNEGPLEAEANGKIGGEVAGTDDHRGDLTEGHLPGGSLDEHTHHVPHPHNDPADDLPGDAHDDWNASDDDAMTDNSI